METPEKTDAANHEPDPESDIGRHGFDNVMRGLLAVKPKAEKKSTSKKQRNATTD